MKRNSGVTLIELTIVIIIIMIIAAFSVATGRDTLEETDKTEVYEEINTIRTVTNSMILKEEMDETFKPQEGKHYDFTVKDVIDAGLIPSSDFSTDVINNLDDWYIIFGRDNEVIYEASEVRKELKLSQINRSYIVNYKNCKVELLEPITLGGVSVKTYDEIRSLVEN